MTPHLVIRRASLRQSDCDRPRTLSPRRSGFGDASAHHGRRQIGAGVDYVVTHAQHAAAAMNQAARRQRKPSIRKTIAAAERSGKTVTSITTPDGVTLHFGKGEPTEASNPWPLDDFKVTKQ